MPTLAPKPRRLEVQTKVHQPWAPHVVILYQACGYITWPMWSYYNTCGHIIWPLWAYYMAWGDIGQFKLEVPASSLVKLELPGSSLVN
jgi:hypothetical protein